MELHTEAFCWGLCLAMMGWGFVAGWFYWRFRYCRMCLANVLFVIGKLDRRGVMFPAWDAAVVNVAISFLNETK